MIREILQWAVPISFWIFGVPAISYWYDVECRLRPEPYWEHVVRIAVIFPLVVGIFLGSAYGVIKFLWWLY